MEIRFDGKVVLVTGASSGIGRATALEFAKLGARVIVHYNQSEVEANKLIEEIKAFKGEATPVKADVSKSQEVKNLVDKVISIYGTVDILINNAGSLVHRENLETYEEEIWDEVINVNLKSIFLVSKAIFPIMKKKGAGKIINLSSVAARTGGSVGSGPYSTAKGGILTLTKNMAKEFGVHNVIVNAVSPGIVLTRFHDRFTTPEILKKFTENIVLKRGGSAEDCVWAILFLASQYSNYILGETIEINGGLLMD